MESEVVDLLTEAVNSLEDDEFHTVGDRYQDVMYVSWRGYTYRVEVEFIG